MEIPKDVFVRLHMEALMATGKPVVIVSPYSAADLAAIDAGYCPDCLRNDISCECNDEDYEDDNV